MFPKLQDMRRTDEEKLETAQPAAIGNQPEYPYGLSICLTESELEKLGLEADCEVGDLLHLFALAKVTSVSKTDTGNGSKCRVELQIVMLGTESENEENEEESENQHLRKHGYLIENNV